MTRVLILSSNCFKYVSANGMCARALRDAFVQLGCETHLVGIGDSDECHQDGNRIEHHVNVILRTDSNQTISRQLMNHMKSIQGFFSPVFDKNLISKYYGKLKQVMEEWDFDIIISMYYPFEFYEVSRLLKSKYSKPLYVGFELDSSTNHTRKLKPHQILLRNTRMSWLRSYYNNVCDCLCVLKIHENHIRDN